MMFEKKLLVHGSHVVSVLTLEMTVFCVCFPNLRTGTNAMHLKKVHGGYHQKCEAAVVTMAEYSQDATSLATCRHNMVFRIIFRQVTRSPTTREVSRCKWICTSCPQHIYRSI